MSCAVALPLLGPPAVGKSTLAIRLGVANSGMVFRLREHVPPTRLMASGGSATSAGWIGEVAVERALDAFLGQAAGAGAVRCVVFDNFPGTPSQVRILIARLAVHSAECVVVPIELSVDAVTLLRRAVQRRVCHRCERDPTGDPRLPAEASHSDPQRCARCGGVPYPRRGDAPSLRAARLRRYLREAMDVRGAFWAVGIEVSTCDTSAEIAETAASIHELAAARSVRR